MGTDLESHERKVWLSYTQTAKSTTRAGIHMSCILAIQSSLWYQRDHMQSRWVYPGWLPGGYETTQGYLGSKSKTWFPSHKARMGAICWRIVINSLGRTWVPLEEHFNSVRQFAPPESLAGTRIVFDCCFLLLPAEYPSFRVGWLVVYQLGDL